MKRFLLIISLFFFTHSSFGQPLKDKETTNYTGFFNFYYEESQDKIYLEVDKVDYEFLYVSSLASGVGSNDIGLDRGQLGGERVVKFIKAGNKLLLIQPNLDYRAITDNELEKRSVEQAFAKSVLFGFTIVENNNGKYIIDLTPFLMQDMHGVSNRLSDNKQGSYKIDSGKSALALERTKAFPKNVEFEALLTFSGTAKGYNIRSVTPNSSNVSVIQHHSFLELPDSNYKKREFDVRSGAFAISYLDYATPVQEQIKKQYIVRHRLEKKQGSNEAKEPIIYYLDPGTPEPVRSALLEGGQWWNQAFESIGYKDAFQVKMLPEDADPMDCRYNVIQWVHRSTRGWSYGASVVDPRTGEIIKGHVSLGSLRIRQDFMIAQALMNKPFAERDDNYEPMLELALARIRQLSAHEIGHTLGFAHNFAASTNNRASVMDYPHPKFSIQNNTIDFSDAYATGIGEWDKVSVAYSYSEFDDNIDEKVALNNILDDANERGLRYISDSDARPQGGAHALAHLWDNGKTASEELNHVLKVRDMAINNFSVDNIKSYEPYSVLEDVFVPLYFFHRFQTEAVSKVIGGLDYNYAVKNGNQFTTKTVEVSSQRAALNSILKTINAETLAIPKEKLDLFPPRAYGYYRTRESFKGKTGVAFDALSVASTASDMTLNLLLHPERANRLIQQKSFDSDQLGLSEVLNTVIENSFGLKHKDNYLNEIQQMINVEVLQHIMNLAVSDNSFFQVKAEANAAVSAISKLLYDKKKPLKYASQYAAMIRKFNEKPELFKLKPTPKIPDGSPIGTTSCNFN